MQFRLFNHENVAMIFVLKSASPRSCAISSPFRNIYSVLVHDDQFVFNI